MAEREKRQGSNESNRHCICENHIYFPHAFIVESSVKRAEKYSIQASNCAFGLQRSPLRKLVDKYEQRIKVERGLSIIVESD
jgi:hypothetical protein